MDKTQKSIANGTFRAPGFVVVTGYDRELALESVGGGWAGIINALFDIIDTQRVAGELSPDFAVVQVKEKFGGLRVYVDSPSEAIMRAVSRAEAESFRTCERCGEPGVPRMGGWITTLCDGHSNGRPPFDDAA